MHDDWEGYDLASAEETEIPPHSTGVVKTDFAITLPKNRYGRIAGPA